jgi:hypothetical protein
MQYFDICIYNVILILCYYYYLQYWGLTPGPCVYCISKLYPKPLCNVYVRLSISIPNIYHFFCGKTLKSFL